MCLSPDHSETVETLSQENDFGSRNGSEAHLNKTASFSSQILDGEYKLGDYEPYDAEVPFEVAEAYDIVEAVVSSVDDPTLPVITFRVILMGALFGVGLAIANTAFSFRTSPFSINPLFVLLVSYPIGHAMYWTLSPRIYTIPFLRWKFTLNPGPFNFKEHALIYVCVSTASNPAYAMYNIISQRYFLNQNLGIGWCLFFAIVTQVIGFGVAGLFRRFLVRPAGMLWPSTLTTIATLRSMHESTALNASGSAGGIFTDAGNPDDVRPNGKLWMSKKRFFWLCCIGMFVYQWFPSFVAPVLSAVSLLCYAPFDQKLRMFGSARQGLGIASFSFDWSIIGQLGPIVSPVWAIYNQYFGLYLFIWIVTPLLWNFNAFGGDQLLGTNPFEGPKGTGMYPLGQALNTPALFNKNGASISPLALLNQGNGTLTLNQDAYAANKPIYITTLYAVQYLACFATFSSSFVHCLLWYRKDIWHRFTSAVRDLDVDDIHAQMMDQYEEVPDSWYGFMLLACTIGAFSFGTWGGFELDWWAVVLSLTLVGASILPVGIIEAVSGQRVATNVIAEVIFGFIQPGHIVSLMSFKTLTATGTYQALSFLEDLKLAHYAKIPPRAMFGVQLVSTVVCSCVNVFVGTFVFDLYKTFVSAGSIWGSIGSANFFGPGSPYFACLLGFAIGIVAPVLPYALHVFFPLSFWRLVNVPIITVFHSKVGALRSDLVTPLIVAVLMNHVVKRRYFEWWQRYAYVLSSAFDMGSGLALGGVLLGYLISPRFRMPVYALNPVDGEGCVPK
ncbi:OPT oligopeptide transporter protein-domain-containing protein [Chytriomyces sp. MP71]|nr:OPT oligopeptide transporter protein-domain-containing protein [Chytriomyces sp. MP71]